jgi:hypothetical protein
MEKEKAAEKNCYQTLTDRTTTESISFAFNTNPSGRAMETRQDNS